MGHSTDLILVYSNVKFPSGALLTQEAYLKFLSVSGKSEKESHKASLVRATDTVSMKLEFYQTLELH